MAATWQQYRLPRITLITLPTLTDCTHYLNWLPGLAGRLCRAAGCTTIGRFFQEKQPKICGTLRELEAKLRPRGILKPEGYVVEKFGGLADTLYIYRNVVLNTAVFCTNAVSIILYAYKYVRAAADAAAGWQSLWQAARGS